MTSLTGPSLPGSKHQLPAFQLWDLIHVTEFFCASEPSSVKTGKVILETCLDDYKLKYIKQMVLKLSYLESRRTE